MASAAVAYGRTIRPFPTKRLAEITYHVVAEANSINDAVTRLLIDPPGSPERWCQGLQEITRMLWSLEERCGEIRPLVGEMYDDADRAFDVAVKAMETMLRGLQQMGEPPDLDAVEATAAAA